MKVKDKLRKPDPEEVQLQEQVKELICALGINLPFQAVLVETAASCDLFQSITFQPE